MIILVPIGCRADMGLSAPIIRRLGEAEGIEVSPVKLIGGKFKESYEIMAHWIKAIAPDWALIVGDRTEMTGAAGAAFHNNVPIAHYFGGILNDPIATKDDINRHVITLWADMHFCESYNTAHIVKDICNFFNKKSNIHIVGITHLEDLAFDMSLVPDEPYDLVLYNPITSYSEEKNEAIRIEEMDYIFKLTKTDNTIFICPNPDPGAQTIIQSYHLIPHELPRAQFLGLLKNCKRFISNSSATVYEAPYFLSKKNIIKIGKRNKNRPYEFKGYTASKEIVDTFKKMG